MTIESSIVETTDADDPSKVFVTDDKSLMILKELFSPSVGRFTDDDFPEVILIDSVTYINPNTIITLNDLSFNYTSCVVGNASINPLL